MKRLHTTLALVLIGLTAFAQHSGAESDHSSNFNLWFGLIEIPFLVFVVVLSFMVASALKGGRFGSGMGYIAWSFLVMAIGHIHMQIQHITDFNLFKYLLGDVGGTTAWFAALIVTWSLATIGFLRLYKASRM